MSRVTLVSILCGAALSAIGCAQPAEEPQPAPAAPARAAPPAAKRPAARPAAAAPPAAPPSAPSERAAQEPLAAQPLNEIPPPPAEPTARASTDELPPAKAAEPLDPRTEAKARRLVTRAMQFYSKGEYDKAEELLKEAVTLYPFLPDANLALGKIFLIRGSATRDRAMINSARLMFEMARALDPTLREAAVLLQLFQSAPPE